MMNGYPDNKLLFLFLFEYYYKVHAQSDVRRPVNINIMHAHATNNLRNYFYIPV